MPTRRACLLAAALTCALGARPAAAQQANVDGVSLRATLSADTVYVGQQVTYTLSVRIPTEVRQRLRRNPEFVPPEPRAMLAYDLPLSRVGEAGDPFETHTFRRALFVLTPGRYTLGQARLSYALPQSPSFFSREDERTLRAEGLAFVAVEPPLRGRPADWAGAVGQWQASLRAEPTSTRVGDPFVLVLRLEGTGNATLLPRPPLTIPWADVVAQDERVNLDSTPAMFGGSKEFAWLVTPREPGAQVVPALQYPTFDPARRRYERISTAPLTVSVRPGTLVDVPTRFTQREEQAPLAVRAAPAGATRVAVPGQVPLTWLAVLAPLPWLILRLRPRRRRAASIESPPAQPPTVRALLEQGLRRRTGVDLGAHPTPGALLRALRLEGVTDGTAAEVEELRDDCDRQGFADAGPQRPAATEASLRARATAVMQKVDAEARRRILLFVLALSALGGCADAAADPAMLESFAEGRTAYAGGDYQRAQLAFSRAATLAPRDAAAWANFGAASWQAGDTAGAVFGWQRALRLEPGATDVREGLARVPTPQLRGVARVWPFSPLPLFAAGIVLWLAGWAWAWLGRLRQRPSRGPLALLLPALLALSVAALQEQRLVARDLVVIRERSPLRALPALGAEPGAIPMSGEVAHIVERRGVWLRLELEGGRSGWFPVERTLRLSRD